ncbi:MAG: trigger factor, partial [Planctomycetota bacterium]
MEAQNPMEFTVEPAGPCRRKVTVTIPPERVAAEFEKSYHTWSRNVPIPGFRPGRAPRKLVERRYGPQVAEEVKQHLLEAAYEEALQKNDLDPISEPELSADAIDLEPERKVSFDFTVTVRPEFELPPLRGIEVEVAPAEPTDEDVAGALRALQRRKATLKPVDDAAAVGDVVSLRVRGSSGDQELFHEENLPYEVGSRYLGGLIPEDLDEALAGRRAGERVEAAAAAPPHEEQHPLAGVRLSLDAEILDIKRPELPPVDDRLAGAFDFDSRAELEAAVRRDVGRRKESERNRLIEDLARLVG